MLMSSQTARTSGPEVPNTDCTGCSHCGRLLSRTWLYHFPEEARVGAADVRATWFCAGSKSKSQCRDKARRLCAKRWDGETAPVRPFPQSCAVGEGSFQPSSGLLKEELSPLGSYIQAALRQNDSEMLSRLLMQAHASGLSVSDVFAQTHHQVTARPITLPPRFSSIFYREGSLCMAFARRGDKAVRACTSELSRRFGVTSVDLQTTAVEQCLLKFVHPEDASRMAATMMEVIKQHALASAKAGGKKISVEVNCPPMRLVDSQKRCSALYPLIKLEMCGGGDEISALICWRATRSENPTGSGTGGCGSSPLVPYAEIPGANAHFRCLLAGKSSLFLLGPTQESCASGSNGAAQPIRRAGVPAECSIEDGGDGTTCSGTAHPVGTDAAEMNVDDLLDLIDGEDTRLP